MDLGPICQVQKIHEFYNTTNVKNMHEFYNTTNVKNMHLQV